jgi:predicted phosphoribosyltransferase
MTMVPGGLAGPREGLPVEVAMSFTDRTDAGRRLTTRLVHLRGEPAVVLGLPRGGVPVALEVARVLGASLDVIIVRKLVVPFQFYGDFSQTTDDEVIACLEQAAATRIPVAGHRGFHR